MTDAERDELISALYKQYYRFVYSTCLRISRNISDAEDFAQDVFITVRNNLDQFRHEAQWKSYLYRIAVNRVLMHWRKKSVICERVTETGDLPESFDYRAGEQQIFTRLQMDEAIKKLPRGYREVFTLHEIHGYQHDEVAEIVGFESGTSKSQLHKAKAKLKQEINKRK